MNTDLLEPDALLCRAMSESTSTQDHFRRCFRKFDKEGSLKASDNNALAKRRSNYREPPLPGKAALSPRSLSERRISHIVSVCTEPIPADSPASGIRQLRIPIQDVDYADLLIYLPRACQFIHQAMAEGGNVLVHCTQGLSRSAAVVAAYLMCSRRIRPTEALEIVRRSREQAWVNPGFQEQLVLFELCEYNPTVTNGIYRNWRQKIERYIREGRIHP